MSTFVIPCKYSKEVPIIFNCLKSIRKYHPNAEIFIIDSDSDDKSYFDRAREEFGAEVCDVKNQNYTSGAIWYTFNNIEREFYYFFHDSIELLDNLSFLEQNTVNSVMYHKHWQWPRSPIDGNRNYQWPEEQIKQKTNISFKQSEFPLLQGAMICCSRSVLQQLKDLGFNNILPSNKYEEECTERLWGLALDQLGYGNQMIENSILGLCRTGEGPGTEFLRKYGRGESKVVYDGIEYSRASDGRYNLGNTEKCFLPGINFIVKKNKYRDGDKVIKYWCSSKRK